MSIIRHNTLTSELGSGLVGAAQWDEAHEILSPLSPRPGSWGNMSVTASLNGTLVLAANRIYLMPLMVRRATPIDRLAVQVTTGVAASTMRIGLYEGIAENGVNGEAGWPGALLEGSGDLASSTSSAVNEIVVSRTLRPDRQYWTAVWASAAITVRALNTNNAPLLTARDNTAFTGVASLWVSATYAGGAWPNPAGLNIAQLGTALDAAQNQSVPVVSWRNA